MFGGDPDFRFKEESIPKCPYCDREMRYCYGNPDDDPQYDYWWCPGCDHRQEI